MWHYYATLVRVVDGDTVDLDVDLGFHIKIRERFRLTGIDAPEPRGATRVEGRAATAALKRLLEGRQITVTSEKQGSFRRWLGSLMADDIDVSAWLVGQGHAEWRD